MKKLLTPLVVANWKMNPQSASLANRIATDVRKGVLRTTGVEVVIAPPAIFIAELAKGNGKTVMLGAQNVHFENLGARTGETSLLMVKSYGIGHVIIGHSERRAMGETNEEVNKKVLATLKAGLIPIVCVGEEKRDHGALYYGFIEKQVRAALAGVSKAKLSQIVIAYEPIWAIGTGNTATPGDAHEMKLFIQKVLTDMYGRNYAMKVRILYGGSVHAKNAEELMVEGVVDGFLVGGASLKADEFTQIVKVVKRVHEAA